tara:strand:- start:5439 stop:5825 length:387 start_codon:yes stop_codon:yes gene_type:complete
MYNPNFDIDLEFGQVYEEKIKTLLESKGKIEVKSERDTWLETGNIAIEYRCRGKRSGIAKTEADWWFHVLTLDGDMVGMICFPVLRLKLLMKAMYDKGIAKKVSGGDDNASEMLLLPLNELYSQQFYK